MSWSIDQLEQLYTRYPYEPAAAIAQDVGKTVKTVQKMAQVLGIQKSPEFIEKQRMEAVLRMQHAGNRKRQIQEKTILSPGEKRIGSGIVSKAGNVTVHRSF